jgi:hypothetical protein
MSTGLNLKNFGGVLVLSVAVLCSSGSAAADQASSTHQSSTHQTHQKKAKKPPLPPLPSGPTGPVQQIPLDSIGAVPPQVSYQDNQLTIVAPNSTLADILRAVRKQTGAEIEVPSAPERVVTHLGPGPARDVVAELLNGSRFNYVLLGSPQNQTVLTRVVLVPKSGPENPSPIAAAPDNQQAGDAAPADPDAGNEGQEAESNDENTDDGTDQAATEEQPATAPDQTGGVKTPQQMLQEMQQRQMQLQQQQPPGQPPIPGTGIAPRPPQEQ